MATSTAPLPMKHDSGDSGLAALAAVAQHHGLQAGVAALRRIAAADGHGVDTIRLLYAAGKCGLDAVPLEGEFDQLPEVQLPAIVVFRDGQFAVLHEVDSESAVVGVERARLSREDFCEQWTGDVLQLTPNGDLETAQKALRQAGSPWTRASELAGLAPVSVPRLLFAGGTVLWTVSLFCCGAAAILTGGCMLASLWMAAFPKGCGKCEATASLSGALPLPAIGAVFYSLLTGALWWGVPLAWVGLLAASGAHLGLAVTLARKKIACYPCLATAAMAWTATGLFWRTPGMEWLALPAGLIAAVVGLHVGGRWAVWTARDRMLGLAQRVFREMAIEPGQARLLVFGLADCPYCAYFKSVIRPMLEEEFGGALVVEERDAASLKLAVPLFFISGSTRIALARVATDEMYPRVSAAVRTALEPAAQQLGMLGGFHIAGFEF